MSTAPTVASDPDLASGSQARGAHAYLPFLDGIRGVAVLMVFLFHSLGTAFGFDRLKWNGLFRGFDTNREFLLLYPLTYGSAGVAVFFVVSGFCIHLSYRRSKTSSWSTFFGRRFFRIAPPYLAAVLIFFFCWPWGELSIASFPRLAQLATHLLAIHNFDSRTFYGINPSFWSIAVEIQLYAIYPILIWLTCRHGWKKSIIAIAAIEVGIRLAIAVNGLTRDEELPRLLTSSPFAYWLSWSVGAYLAECHLNGETSRMRGLHFSLIALCAIAAPLFKPTSPFSFLAFALLTGVVIDRLTSGTWKTPTSRIFDKLWQHLCFLGIISYSFYLLHQPLLKLIPPTLKHMRLDAFSSPLAQFSMCLLAYAPILLVAYGYFHLVEQPAVRAGRRFTRSNRPLKDVAAPVPSVATSNEGIETGKASGASASPSH